MVTKQQAAEIVRDAQTRRGVRPGMSTRWGCGVRVARTSTTASRSRRIDGLVRRTAGAVLGIDVLDARRHLEDVRHGLGHSHLD